MFLSSLFLLFSRLTVSRLLGFHIFFQKKSPYIFTLKARNILREMKERERERERDRDRDREKERHLKKWRNWRNYRKEKRKERKEKRAGTLCQLPFVLLPFMLYLPKC